jgi:hypothetical protein
MNIDDSKRSSIDTPILKMIDAALSQRVKYHVNIPHQKTPKRQ